MPFLNMLKGISGEYEINRVVGAFGAAAYVVCANLFVAWDMLYRGHTFDVVAYCAAFPAGLAIAVGGIAGAVALKDRNVATATVVRDTGGQPTSAAAPAGTPAGTEDDPLIVAGAPKGTAPVQTEEAGK